MSMTGTGITGTGTHTVNTALDNRLTTPGAGVKVVGRDIPVLVPCKTLTQS